MERLDQIVVGSKIKSFDPIGHTVARRQEQNGGVNVRLPKLSDERPAITLGQRDIENDEIHFPARVHIPIPARHLPPRRRRSHSRSNRA